MSRKIHAMIEYIKANDLFDLDLADIEYMSGYEVLYRLGLEGIFVDDEEELFMREIRTLAEQNQTAEISKVSSVF